MAYCLRVDFTWHKDFLPMDYFIQAGKIWDLYFSKRIGASQRDASLGHLYFTHFGTRR